MIKKLRTFIKDPVSHIPYSLEYNPSIDGLRGISILLVLLFHYFPDYFPSGYVGVDVFFVISGYLITRIIYTRIREDRFSFLKFYRNRIRRILPAMVVVLLVALFAGYLFLLPHEYESLGRHIASSAFYFQNFRLMEEMDYWDVASIYKPLLHIWSLSVEEQFYLVWPLILFLLYRLKLLRAGSIILLLSVLLGCSVYWSFRDTNIAFYHTLSRSWELFLGASINFIQKDRLRAVVRWIPDWFLWGLFVIFLLPPAFSFSALNLLPLLLCVFLILNRVTEESSRYTLLSSTPFVFLGLLSYSLYLWHFLFLSFFAIVGRDSLMNTLLALLLSFLSSMMSFLYVEIPLRRTTQPIKIILILLSITLVGFGGLFVEYHKGLPERTTIEEASKIYEEMKRDRAEDSKCNELLNRSIKEKRLFRYCRATTENPERVNYLVFGDSHAQVYYYGIAKVMRKRGKEVAMIAASGCPPYRGLARGYSREGAEECRKKIDQMYRVLMALKQGGGLSGVIFVTRAAIYVTERGFGKAEVRFNERPKHLMEYFDDPADYDPEKLFFEKVERTFDFFEQKDIPVYYLLENPELGFDPKRCLPRFFLDPPVCTVSEDVLDKRQRSIREQIRELADGKSRVQVVDIAHLFCDGRFCYAEKDGHFLYCDDDHLSRYGSLLVAEYLEKIIR